MRSRQQTTTLLAVVILIGLSLTILRNRSTFSSARSPSPPPPLPPPEPVKITDHFLPDKTHPVESLVRNAQDEQRKMLSKQSRTLEEAVAEYKRRYKVHPPPHFDKWYKFARDSGTPIIDEYDTVHSLTLPFWGLRPSTIRARAREALGFPANMLMRVSVRRGRVVSIGGAEEWQCKATEGMMSRFAQYLPDMDLAFNIQDEPRVVVPHDDLARLIGTALDSALPTALANPTPQSGWTSPAPGSLGDGMSIPEARTTRFNVFAHQPTWTHSRQSCAPWSAARSLEDAAEADDIEAYAASEVGFVGNKTAFTDVCNSPSLQARFGFFDRPNAYNVVHDLFPVFSQSKISAYQDLIYPSPWYWADKVHYSESQDVDWAAKEHKLWWRGSTTGGFSRNGGWRRQHRQHVVAAINAEDDALALENVSLADGTPKWRLHRTPKPQLSDLFDVLFSHVGQCDDGDCQAQRDNFRIAPTAKQDAAWRYRYLLDVDGNAFSGRFYAFLRSKSLPFKMAVFREWHDEWIKPWVHYVPLSLRATEYHEAVRYFDRQDEGIQQAREIAEQGRDWAGKVLRNADLEVWFFRLLLEYGRLVDDNRDKLGFVP